MAQTVSSGWPARFVAFVLLASLAIPGITGCGSAPAGFAGYDWRVTAISHGGKVTKMPPGAGVDLQFGADSRLGADDGVNSYSGTYRMDGSGFTTSLVAGTAEGYAGRDPVVLLGISAIAAFANHAHATFRLTGERFVVTVGSYTLTTQRDGPPTGLAIGQLRMASGNPANNQWGARGSNPEPTD